MCHQDATGELIAIRRRPERRRLAASLAAQPEAAETGPVPELGELLAEPTVQHWAEWLLKPLRAGPDPRLLPAVRAWLAAGHKVTFEATRTAGLSRTVMRRQIERAELLLGWALTRDGSRPYDLHLALTAADRR